MTEIQIAYQGDLRCRAVHASSGAAMETDAPKDNMGQGRSFSPTDLMATALGTCMMTIMGIAARNRGIDLGELTVTVGKEMSTAPPRRIARLPVTIRVSAALPEDQRRMFERAALTCPVHKSLHPEIDSPVTFQWGEAPARSR